jgi:Protein of unknown function (DUF1553)/Protein of unknown function (DUF1549)
MRTILIALAFAMTLVASDGHCPAYPSSQREADRIQFKKQQDGLAFSLQKRAPVQLSVTAANFIDDFIFGNMAADGVPWALQSSDTEFLRRVYLDLTGRIPSSAEVAQFLADSNPDKRQTVIDSLMTSPAFVDYWTAFFANHLEVTSGYYNFIGIPGRNLFYQYLRQFVAGDRSYAEVASELIAGAGDSHVSGPPNFMVRGFQQGDPIQDTWDATSDRITKKFLGIKTECVSCHNGAHHLEPINAYLAARQRIEFWRQSAFLSRTNFLQLAVDAFNQQWHFILIDRATGGYSSVVDPNNPGPRPSRSGGPYTPVYMFTGERPQSDNWRGELGRMVTSDRQFARATVNYIWAHFFKYGIVDPPDGWDLARIDPSNPPAAPWTLQPTHPELMEALADDFIRSGYSIRHLVKTIVASNAYQLSSKFEGEWRPEYERYFAKHFPRRLSAEEIYDAMMTATETEKPMIVEGFDQPLYFATQLPDPTEPRNDFSIRNFLSNFGRGDWWQVVRTSDTNVLQVLYLMNDNMINFRTFGTRSVSTRVSRILESNLSDEEAVNELFLSTLGRRASNEELALLQKRKTPSNYEQWLSDIQWTLLNKVDFIFNY